MDSDAAIKQFFACFVRFVQCRSRFFAFLLATIECFLYFCAVIPSVELCKIR